MNLGRPRKGPVDLFGLDRINAELQRGAARYINDLRNEFTIIILGGEINQQALNAELQRAPAVSEMQQVGVPASAGLSSNRQKATALPLELTTCNSN